MGASCSSLRVLLHSLAGSWTKILSCLDLVKPLSFVVPWRANPLVSKSSKWSVRTPPLVVRGRTRGKLVSIVTRGIHRLDWFFIKKKPNQLCRFIKFINQIKPIKNGFFGFDFIRFFRFYQFFKECLGFTIGKYNIHLSIFILYNLEVFLVQN